MDSEKQGEGYGTEFLQEMISKLDRPVIIRLTVNRQNFKSINFYFKNGFVIEKVADFDIGGGYIMNDFVMTRRLNPKAI
jgi:RimJ/RimL family protein N-acetyltransferase